MPVPPNSAARPATAADRDAIERFLARTLSGVVRGDALGATVSQVLANDVMIISSGSGIAALVPWHLPADGAAQIGLPLSKESASDVDAVRAAALELLRAGARSVHVALEPGDPFARIFAKAGLRRGSLMRELSARVGGRVEAAPGEWLAFESARRALFAETFYRTFEGSVDCRELPPNPDGALLMRAFEERGAHDPDDFAILLDDGAPAGVIFVVHSRDAAEIAYLGVVPQHRGRGLGRLLVERAFERAAARRAAVLTVTADSQNTPALALYRKAGFSEKRAVRVHFMAAKVF